ncbi:MAG TPA: metallophosphoesterase family protein, partial [Ktedonobacteraceae bacterium]|nr:metallophosphoesterase family protein [Ktedonobacteraceae bacterium]
MEHRVGIISDTHIPRFGNVPDAVWQHFTDLELIIHAGDLSIPLVIDALETIAPVLAVQGNVESAEVVSMLPLKRTVTVGYCKIGVV